MTALAVVGVVLGLMTGLALADADADARRSQAALRCGLRGQQLAAAVNRTAAVLLAVARSLPPVYDAAAFARAANVTLAAGMAAVAITAAVRQNRSQDDGGGSDVAYPLLWSSQGTASIGSDLLLETADSDARPVSINGSTTRSETCLANVTIVARGDPFIIVAPVCAADTAVVAGDDTAESVRDDDTDRAAEVVVRAVDRDWAVRCPAPGASPWPILVGTTVAGVVLALDLAFGLHLVHWRRAQAAWADVLAAENERRQQMLKACKLRADFVHSLVQRLRASAQAAADLAAFAQRPGPGPELQRDKRQSLELLDDHIGAISAVCEQVVDLAEIGHGQVKLERAPFSLQALLERLDRRLRPLAEAKRLEMIVAPLETSLPSTLIGDQRRLYQVLFNAVSNAIKFTSRGSVTVYTQTLPTRGGSGSGAPPIRLQFTVTDTGPGFPPPLLQTLAELGDDIDFLSAGRIGLGLVTMKKLCVLMGGDLTVEAEPNGSARVRLRVVVGYDRNPGRTSASLSGRLSGPSFSHSLGSLSAATSLDVLLVEDNPTSAKIALHMMQNVRNLRVVHVGDGVQALAAVGVSDSSSQLADFALILMDVSLPQMDGNEATRRIRAMGLTLPIVAMTASSLPHQHRASLESGMNDILVKPFTRSQLLAMISSHTRIALDDGQQQARETVVGTAPVDPAQGPSSGSPGSSTSPPRLRLRPSC